MMPNIGTYKGRRISPMQITILALLKNRPMYGYEILKRLRDLFEGTWVPKTGSVYPSLKRLEEHGLISSKDEEGINYYSLTAEGEAWISNVLASLPMDIFMASRWFMRMLMDASGVAVGAGAQDPDLQAKDFCVKLKAILEREHPDSEGRLKHLHVMKERMRLFIEQIEDLEKEIEEERR
jgi:DNA-binding PadR family transcriptional regulator